MFHAALYPGAQWARVENFLRPGPPSAWKFSIPACRAPGYETNVPYYITSDVYISVYRYAMSVGKCDAEGTMDSTK